MECRARVTVTDDPTGARHSCQHGSMETTDNIVDEWGHALAGGLDGSVTEDVTESCIDSQVRMSWRRSGGVNVRKRRLGSDGVQSGTRSGEEGMVGRDGYAVARLTVDVGEHRSGSRSIEGVEEVGDFGITLAERGCEDDRLEEQEEREHGCSRRHREG